MTMLLPILTIYLSTLNNLVTAQCLCAEKVDEKVDEKADESDYDDLFCTNYTEDIGGEYKPSRGGVWPTPKIENREEPFFELDPDILKIEYDNKTFPLLIRIVARFQYQLNTLAGYSNATREAKNHYDFAGEVELIKIEVDGASESRPHYNMSEYYKLRVGSNILLETNSVWGVVRGLDTLIQLCYVNEDQMLVVHKNTIEDSPKYRHRGLMIDTDSHFISVRNILRILNGMALNKMNVLHWRIVGDHSFSYKSEALPELSKHGVFHPILVYSADDIEEIIDHAAVRGIRVIPEFNIPGHLRSLEKSHPELVTTCFSGLERRGPLNPSHPNIFKLLKKLLKEVQKRFPENHIHLGGEHIDEECWETNPDIKKYITKNSVSLNLHLYFLDHIVKEMLQPEKILILEQNVFCINMSDVTIPKTTERQIFDERDVERALNCNENPVIVSWPWDLSKRGNTSFILMYEKSESMKKISDCVGGEAFLPGEMIDNSNIFDRIWPRSSIVADVLWHGLDEDNDYRDAAKMDLVHKKLAELACRMNRFGVPAPPVGSGYCIVWEEDEFCEPKKF